MRVVICGGGIIGACTAYFLALRGVATVVVEGTGVACAASGKSGGFLARDWCDGTPAAHLARRSFALHAQLAGELGRDWGYRRLDTLAVAAGDRHGSAASRGGPAWLAADNVVHASLGGPATTAQVDPGAFTRAVMAAAVERGASLRPGRVTGMALDAGGTAVEAVLVDGEALGADAVVIAMGPWSRLATAWLPLPVVFGLKGHSLVFRTEGSVPAQALFVDLTTRDGAVHQPEVFPRPDGTTYVCGLSSESPLPPDPAEVGPDPGACEELHRIAARLSPVLAAAPVLARQACYRPITRDGLPLIGRAPKVANAYIATGHGPWGILQAPATGEALAGLITAGDPGPLDLAPFDPARLPARPPAAR